MEAYEQTRATNSGCNAQPQALYRQKVSHSKQCPPFEAFPVVGNDKETAPVNMTLKMMGGWHTCELFLNHEQVAGSLPVIWFFVGLHERHDGCNDDGDEDGRQVPRQHRIVQTGSVQSQLAISDLQQYSNYVRRTAVFNAYMHYIGACSPQRITSRTGCATEFQGIYCWEATGAAHICE